MRPQQQLTPEVQAERATLLARLETIDPARIKVGDESRGEIGQRLAYGYGARGRRCYDAAPFHSGIVRSLVEWLGLEGSGVVATHEGTVRAAAPLARRRPGGGLSHERLPGLHGLRRGDGLHHDDRAKGLRPGRRGLLR